MCCLLPPWLRRRPATARLSLIIIAIALVPLLLPAEAQAQSLFEALFGGPNPSYRPPSSSRGVPQRLLPPHSANYGQSYMSRPSQLLPHDDTDTIDGRHTDRGTKFKTVCVRMCDGFYWPVSFSTTRQRFYRDGGVCQSSCGSEAKLFYVPTSNGRIEEAQDLSGLAYSRLPNAFRYRKALVEGCACRPEPWSEAEMNRHRIYAEQDALAQAPKIAAVGPAVQIAAVSTPKAAAPAGVVETTAVAEAIATETPIPAIITPTTIKPERAQRTQRRTVAAQQQSARYREPAIQPQRRIRAGGTSIASASQPLFGSGFGGQPKYTWPGDAPARVR